MRDPHLNQERRARTLTGRRVLREGGAGAGGQPARQAGAAAAAAGGAASGKVGCRSRVLGPAVAAARGATLVGEGDDVLEAGPRARRPRSRGPAGMAPPREPDLYTLESTSRMPRPAGLTR